MMSITDRIRAGEFENTVAYPERPSKPRLGSNPTAEAARRFADELELYELLERTYTSAVRAYHKGQSEAIDRFEEALADEYGLTSHPKRNKVWSMAWENGHDCGLSEVVSYYNDYAELVL